MHRQGREPLQQLPANSAAPVLRADEKILQVDPRAAQERRKIVEEQGKADRLRLHAGEHDFGVRTRPEQGCPQSLFTCDDLIFQMLVLSELADEL